MKITEYLLGYVVFYAEADKIRALNYMNRRGIEYYDAKEKDGVLTFKILKKDAKKNPGLSELCVKTYDSLRLNDLFRRYKSN